MNKQTDFLISPSRYPYLPEHTYARVGEHVRGVPGRAALRPYTQSYKPVMQQPIARTSVGPAFLMPPQQPTWTRKL